LVAQCGADMLREVDGDEGSHCGGLGFEKKSKSVQDLKGDGLVWNP
jgi:hypothetical protein